MQHHSLWLSRSRALRAFDALGDSDQFQVSHRAKTGISTPSSGIQDFPNLAGKLGPAIGLGQQEIVEIRFDAATGIARKP